MAKKIFGIYAKEFKKFDNGKEGIVYLGPDNMLLKVYLDPRRCISEYKLLKSMEDNSYFPKVYNCRGNYMLREYVNGTPLLDYINENGLSKRLANNLIDLSEFFYNTKYLRIDGIPKHVFVCENESLMIIDPRRKNYKFHISLLRILKEIGQEEMFLAQLIQNRPELVSQWYEKENIDLDKYRKKTYKVIDKETNEEKQMENKPVIALFKKLRNKFDEKP